MSDDQKMAIPVNFPDDCSAGQPPKDEATCAASPPLVPKVEPGCSRSNGHENTNSDIVRQDVKHEAMDFVRYVYDENAQSFRYEGPKVGFDRGHEPDHIVGATEKNGKLMFLVTWKNLDEADLLESTEVYEKAPQLAIRFFESRFQFIERE